MDHKQNLKDAWQFTQANPKLVNYYGILPSMLVLSFNLGIFSYQFFNLKYSPKLTDSAQSFASRMFDFIFGFFKEYPEFVFPSLVVLGIYILLYFFIPTFCEGALVQLIARKHNKQAVRLSDGLKYGLRSFLKLLKFKLVTNSFKFTSILMEMAVILSYLGRDFFQILGPIFILVLILSLIVAILFTYAESFIIIDDDGIIDSLKKSTGMVVEHWRETMFLFVLMMLVALRVLFNIIVVLGLPFLVSLLFTVIVTYTNLLLGQIFILLVSIFSIRFISKLAGTLLVFTKTVWTFTFLELDKKEILSARDSA